MLTQKIRDWALSTVEEHSSCLHLAKTGAFVITSLTKACQKPNFCNLTFVF